MLKGRDFPERSRRESSPLEMRRSSAVQPAAEKASRRAVSPRRAEKPLE